MDIQAVYVAKKNEKMPSMLGVATLYIDKVLAIKDVRVISGKYGVFLSYPSRKNQDTGEYYDVVYPIDKDFRTELTNAVLKVMDNKKEEEPVDETDLPF